MRFFRGIPLLFAAGCAFGPGEPFATVAPRFEARYEIPSDRQLQEQGWAKLASDYQVRLTAFTLEVAEVELRSRSGGGGGGGGTFDPANPPPGYSQCHGGHCHRDDGALVSYEDIQAELDGGGTATVRTELALHVGREVDLLAGASLVPACEPDCTLDQTRISSVRAGVEAVRIEGFVRDGRAQQRLQGEVPFVLHTPGFALETGADIEADRTSPPQIELTVLAEAGPHTFDAIDWAVQAQAGGVIDFGAVENEAARTQVLDELSAETLNVDVRRR